MLLVGRRQAIKSRLKKLTISITCIDERIAPRPQFLSFRVPGASIFPRDDESSFILAAILFFVEVMKHFDTIRLVVADHGTLGNQGYTGCGMMSIEKILPQIKKELLEENNLTLEQIDYYLSRLTLYDLNNLGGIGQHANWEIKQLEKLQKIFAFETRLGQILPNDEAREQIPNERLVITQPYISQEGLLANTDEQGRLFDGSTNIQSTVGMSIVQLDSNLINGLLIFSYRKGETVKEVLVLEPSIDLFDQSNNRVLIQKIQQMLDYKIQRISKSIANVVNMSTEQCYAYLQSIKDGANTSLYGSETEQLRRAQKLAKEIKATCILPKNMSIKYGLIKMNGKIIKETVRMLEQ